MEKRETIVGKAFCYDCERDMSFSFDVFPFHGVHSHTVDVTSAASASAVENGRLQKITSLRVITLTI